MDILVCVKRVPAIGAKFSLTEDEQAIDARFLGHAVSPHEECAVQEAVNIIKEQGGSGTVLTLGPEKAIEQLRYALAMGMTDAMLLETDGVDWSPMETARAIVAAIKEKSFDLLLFGNESADTGGYQIGIRVAHALGLPIVTGIKDLSFADGKAIAKRETKNGWEIYEVPLPAVITVKEGINLPRYPSVPGRLRAKKKPIERITPEQQTGGLEQIRFVIPEDQGTQVDILGRGPDAAGKVVDLLEQLGVLS